MSKGARIRSVPHRRAKIMERRDTVRAIWILKRKLREQREEVERAEA